MNGRMRVKVVSWAVHSPMNKCLTRLNPNVVELGRIKAAQQCTVSGRGEPRDDLFGQSCSVVLLTVQSPPIPVTFFDRIKAACVQTLDAARCSHKAVLCARQQAAAELRSSGEVGTDNHLLNRRSLNFTADARTTALGEN